MMRTTREPGPPTASRASGGDARPWRRISAAALLMVSVSGCAASLRSTLPRPPTSEEVAAIWVEPTDIASRDLFHGPGGRDLQPDASGPYAFVKEKTGGTSPGYDVRDASDREWSVKLGIEAQAEVVASRILWGVGYHQPPVYYVGGWTLERFGSQTTQPGGRFRPDLPDWKSVGEWRWHENPYVDTRPFRGLVVLMVLLSNWDLKDDNNTIYDVGGAGGTPRRLFAVRDLGAALGKAGFYPQGTKNTVEDFERQGFVKGADGVRARIDFSSRRYRGLFQEIAVDDVRWACSLISRLSDEQLDAAFRAADYSPEDRTRYIASLREKTRAGLELGR